MRVCCPSYTAALDIWTGEHARAAVTAAEAAVLRQITIGDNNGIQAEVRSGLEIGDKVTLYPGAGLTNNNRVVK